MVWWMQRIGFGEYDDWNFGGREHWDVNTTNGVKQGTPRDVDI